MGLVGIERGSFRSRGGCVGQPFVEQARDPVERRLVDRLDLVEEETAADAAFAQDEDQARHPLVDGHEVDPADVGGVRLRGRRARRSASGRRGRRGEPEPVPLANSTWPNWWRIISCSTAGAAVPRSTRRRTGSRRRSARDRHSCGWSEAGGFELGKDAPHGRARDAETVALDQGLAADRLGGRDVFLDDGPKDHESGGPGGRGGDGFDAPNSFSSAG